MSKLSVIHMHIMKTAGMALNARISKHFKERNVFTDQERVGGYPSVDTVRDRFDALVNDYDFITGHFNYGNVQKLKRSKIEQGLDVVDFTILRHPIKRSISIYKFYVKEYYASPERAVVYQGKTKYDLFVNRQISFEEFVDVAPVYFDNFQTRFLCNLDAADMWKKSPPAIDRAAFEQAKRNLHSFRLIGVQENLESFWVKLCEICNWEDNGALSVVNSSSEVDPARIPPHMRNISPSYDTVMKLEKRIYYDLELYEYALDLIKRSY